MIFHLRKSNAVTNVCHERYLRDECLVDLFTVVEMQKNNYIDFYKSRYKIRRKSVYHRKYHIQNVLIYLRQKFDIEMSYVEQQKIERIFNEISEVNDLVYDKRKRMISVNYILRKLFSSMNKPFDITPMTKSKKTLKIYHEFWNKILSLKGDEIERIIKQ